MKKIILTSIAVIMALAIIVTGIFATDLYNSREFKAGGKLNFISIEAYIDIVAKSYLHNSSDDLSSIDFIEDYAGETYDSIGGITGKSLFWEPETTVYGMNSSQYILSYVFELTNVSNYDVLISLDVLNELTSFQPVSTETIKYSLYGAAAKTMETGASNGVVVAPSGTIVITYSLELNDHSKNLNLIPDANGDFETINLTITMERHFATTEP